MSKPKSKPKWAVRHYQSNRYHLALVDSRILWPESRRRNRYFLWGYIGTSPIEPPLRELDITWNEGYATGDLSLAIQGFHVRKQEIQRYAKGHPSI